MTEYMVAIVEGVRTLLPPYDLQISPIGEAGAP